MSAIPVPPEWKLRPSARRALQRLYDNKGPVTAAQAGIAKSTWSNIIFMLRSKCGLTIYALHGSHGAYILADTSRRAIDAMFWCK